MLYFSWGETMKVRWQDEEKMLCEGVYKPEKAKWERVNKVNLGFSHWYAYLSKYAEFRRIEIKQGNSQGNVEARIKRLHPIVWSWAMDWYTRQ